MVSTSAAQHVDYDSLLLIPCRFAGAPALPFCSSSMQNCRVPLELCELIIHFIEDPASWWEGSGRRWRYEPRHLVKYTLICSAWLPQARHVLYYAVVLKRPAQVGLFSRSIAENSSLADMVHELVIKPEDDRYIPFTHHTLVTRLHRLRTLVYVFGTAEKWVYPPRHHELVAKLPIRELSILCKVGTGTMWSEMLRLISSLRNLQILHINWSGHDGAIPYPQTAQTNAIRWPPWACTGLRTLVLEVSTTTAAYMCLTY